MMVDLQEPAARRAYELGLHLADSIFDPTTPLGREIQWERIKREADRRLAEMEWQRKQMAKTNEGLRVFALWLFCCGMMITLYVSEDKMQWVFGAFFSAVLVFTVWLPIRLLLAMFRKAIGW
jgi:hypothetical protein